MTEQLSIWLTIAAVLVGGVLGYTFMKKRRSGNIVAPKQATPHAIVLGEDVHRPAVRIAPLSDEERFKTAKPYAPDSMLAGRLNAGLQAVPSLLVGSAHSGKQLMEVVISGDLVRASDGAGWRAWAQDANGRFSEHAKLHETQNLQSIVNAAAIWQVASMVVAQKHLGDINEKLASIQKGVQEISSFLEEERRSKIHGAYEYLAGAARAASKGELSQAVRIEFESCYRDLLELQSHLEQEFQRKFRTPVEHKEMFGTKDLHRDTLAKYENLDVLLQDIRLTLKTRALACYVFSLYPGEPELKLERMNELRVDMKVIDASMDTFRECADQDGKKFVSAWNADLTLTMRKADVSVAANGLAVDFWSVYKEINKEADAVSARLISYDAPTHLVLEMENGRIGELRIVEPIPIPDKQLTS